MSQDSSDAKHVFLNADEVDIVVYEDIIQDELRYKLDGTCTWVSYYGAKPRWLYGRDVVTDDQLLSVINDPEEGWYDPTLEDWK